MVAFQVGTTTSTERRQSLKVENRKIVGSNDFGYRKKKSEVLIWVLGTSSSRLLDTPLDECGQKSLVLPYMIVRIHESFIGWGT